MKHTLMRLPYAQDALEPYISSETIAYHYGKHHQGYVEKLNALIEGTKFEEMELVETIRQSNGSVFNNASQVYNHNAYFLGLTHEKTEPSSGLLHALVQKFGDLDRFKDAYKEAVLGLFGSGWVWLCLDEEGQLGLHSYSNAQTPLKEDLVPLMTCDVWEHAYYIDYRNARTKYFEKWWQVIDWSYVSQNYARAAALDFSCLADYADVCELQMRR